MATLKISTMEELSKWKLTPWEGRSESILTTGSGTVESKPACPLLVEYVGKHITELTELVKIKDGKNTAKGHPAGPSNLNALGARKNHNSSRSLILDREHLSPGYGEEATIPLLDVEDCLGGHGRCANVWGDNLIELHLIDLVGHSLLPPPSQDMGISAQNPKEEEETVTRSNTRDAHISVTDTNVYGVITSDISPTPDSFPLLLYTTNNKAKIYISNEPPPPVGFQIQVCCDRKWPMTTNCTGFQAYLTNNSTFNNILEIRKML